ncbi:MAG: hypothetical protein JNJ99_08895 [Crocinitomicaceae bacterium]|nr:hypothetical protein [Crocinitomicaceae bacterium]
MKWFVSIFFFQISIQNFAQCESLQFAELGYEPAYCRIASYQSGNGVVYAAATGGTPDYTYQWTNIYTGEIHPGTTIGGLNPGEYHIKITDDAGCVITATVKVDSVLPYADFTVTGIEPNEESSGAKVEFLNTSDDLLNTAFPGLLDTDPNYFWSTNEFLTDTALYFNDPFFAEINSPGIFNVCLITENYNGCRDTVCKSIEISPAVFESEFFDVYYSSVTGEISIENNSNEDAILSLNSTGGTTLYQFPLATGTNNFQIASGLYIYEIHGAITGTLFGSGTIYISY